MSDGDPVYLGDPGPPDEITVDGTPYLLATPARRAVPAYREQLDIWHAFLGGLLTDPERIGTLEDGTRVVFVEYGPALAWHARLAGALGKHCRPPFCPPTPEGGE